MSAVLTFRVCSWLKEGGICSHVHTVFCVKKTPSWHGHSVCLAWSSPPARYCFCGCSVARWIFFIFDFFISSETGIRRSTELEMRCIPYHWWWSNGSVSFAMSSGGQESCSFISRWNQDAATLKALEKRVKRFMSSTKKEERYLCGPRLLSAFDP